MDVRLVARVKKIVSSVTISAIIFSMVSPAFAAVSPTFVALETVPNTIPVNDQTATTTITQTQTVALPKISTVTIANVEVGDMFTATFGGGNSVTFTATTTSASDVASGMNTLIQNHALYPVAPFTSSVAGDTITFTGKVAGANFAQSSSTTNAAPTAQVVTLTPTDVVDGLTFSATVDGNTVSHNTTPGSTVATVTATLAGVLSTAAVTCVDSATHITCTADVAGTPFMYSTNVVDIGAPTVPTNLLPNGTATDNDFDFTWDASTDEVVGAITYEFQSSQNNAVDGSGVLTTGVWTSGTLPTPMIHSSGAPDGVWYWQVRAKDSAGNASAWSPVVSMTIDSVPPVITIDPYTTTPTNGDVTVTASTNEGSLNATSHTFTVNGSFTFIATDAAGNVTNSIVTLTNIDKTAPVITLNGSTPMDVSFGAAYVEPGASCTDNVDLVCSVMINGSVVTSALGTYLVTYDATDSVGNASLQVERTVNVVDIEKPIITLLGTATITVAQNSVYTDAGATASDNVDGDITASIVSGGSVNTSILGDYILTYDVTDSSLNTATQVTRTVTVADLTAPTISEITPVTPTPTNDNTPSYTFSTDEAGTIIYAGGCTSTTTIANVGNNTIELDMLADATYSTCTITVTDNSPAANTSTPLTLSTFTVDTTDPSVTINQAGTQGDPTATSILYFTAILSEAVAGATFTCDDIITTNAVCDSVTNSDINTYTVQVHTLAA